MLNRPSVRTRRRVTRDNARSVEEARAGALLPVRGRGTGEGDPATQASHLPRAVLSADVLNLVPAEYRDADPRSFLQPPRKPDLRARVNDPQSPPKMGNARLWWPTYLIPGVRSMRDGSG
jgi:hypothetical protein